MKNLFVPSKMAYVRGERPVVNCILCAICQKDATVKSLQIYQSENFSVTVNLYPYNPGHLMIFPHRHVTDVRQLREDEIMELHRLEKLSLDILDSLYQPGGYNIGFNLGKNSGASIEHLHLHIIPRYPNEVGFLDILSGTRVIVEDPQNTLEKLKKAFAGAVK